MSTEKQEKYWASMKGKPGNALNKRWKVKDSSNYNGGKKGRKIKDASKMGVKSHKGNCFCSVCKNIRGELQHNKDCQCCICKSIRGESKGKNHPQYGKVEERCHNWKGNDVGYNGIHGWIYRMKGKASEYKCVDCGKWAQHWSNIDHSYRRILENYKARCASCHKRYDNK